MLRRAGAKIIGLGHKVPQLVLQDTLRKTFLSKFKCPIDKNPFAPIIDKTFENTKVRHRGVLIPWETKGSVEDIYKLAGNDLVKLATVASREALTQANLDPPAIDAGIYVSELPGCPPHDSDLYFRKLGMRHSMVQSPMIGLGCAGGTKGLSMAKNYLDSKTGHAVLVTMSECISRVGSTEFEQLMPKLLAQFNDAKTQDDKRKIQDQIMGKIVVGALMGDAAAAAIVVGPDHFRYNHSKGPKMIDVHQSHMPGTRPYVWTRTHEVGAVTHLGREIPDVVPSVAHMVISKLLTNNGLSMKDVKHWILHPGGPKVLERCEEVFDFQHKVQLKNSWESMQEAGNCMSVSVVDVLKRTIELDHPKAGEYGVMLGVGPGMR